MKVIGLTGGIATGKSEVTKILRKMGISVFDADAAVHELYQNGIAASNLKRICPEAIMGHEVDRQRLAALIVKQPDLLRKIEEIIHPLVRNAEHRFISKAKASQKTIVVIDSPLLIETGHYKDMDVNVLVTTDKHNQIARATDRPSMTKEKIELLLAKQTPTDEKRKLVDLVIENNATIEELEVQVRVHFQKLMDT